MPFTLRSLWNRGAKSGANTDERLVQQSRQRVDAPPLPAPAPLVSDASRRNGDPRTFPIVTVAFRTLDGSDKTSWSNPAYGYAYRWPFIKEPQVGDWAIVNGIEGSPCNVVVLLLGMHPANDYPEEALVELIDLVPAEEVRRLERQYAADLAAWMNDARHVAGISPTSVERTVTDRFPSIPPVVGPEDASDSDAAYGYGQQWYRIYRQAQELGFDQSEVATHDKIARTWFKRSEILAEMEIDATLTWLIDSGALIARRPPLEVTQGERAGHQLAEWLRHARRLARDGNDRRALEVLSVIIDDEVETARSRGESPSFAFTDRAGIIHRKARDFVSEIAVIERYLASSDVLSERDEQAARHRLAKAHSLLEKSGAQERPKKQP